MSRIIALRGRGGSGKTTTINMLPAILVLNGYHQVPVMYRQYGSDFLDMYENGQVIVGITSSGDTYDLVYERLTDLVNANCNVCICVCRTRDNVHPGTIAAVNCFPGYTATFVQKSYAIAAGQAIANATDASTLFQTI